MSFFFYVYVHISLDGVVLNLLTIYTQ